ncbi:acyl-CoA--6-aminopenicillanic acid acyltransferase [Achromobacter sp. ACM01]|uniref:C45 family autoproteolytic acyltransferase/hydolase n=1 Tax=Achromobacter sp. ACM01 TaxID=2769298 RepID=UPI00177D098E|nr:C45 family peptidase [Achromobacter sp. ACM01]MBD9474135.1 acyl-CoA--6-aminopenicillanic acid acyltransferase [Achromobacter sp. ACM01]
MKYAPFPLVSISGAPFERGVQYGRAVPERIARSARHYRGELDKIGTSMAAQAALIKEFADQIQKFDPAHTEEMRGIAQGAGCAFDDVALINARTEVIAKARLLAKMGNLDPAEGECTAALVMPGRSATGTLIHAHNWDWEPDACDSTIVLRATLESGITFLTLVEAGGLARHGFNSAGIGLTGNYLSSDRDYTQTGVPLSSVRRAVLCQQHVAIAMQLIAATPKACSSNMIVSQNGWVIDFECAPDESFTLLPQDGLLTHSNHFMSEVALGKLREAGLKNAVDTYYRAWRVRQLLDACGPRITVTDVRRALADDWATPYSVCRPPRGTLTGGRSATVATLVLDTAGLTMDIAAMPSFGQFFTRYGLEGEAYPID